MSDLLKEIIKRPAGQWTLEEWERIRVAIMKGELEVHIPLMHVQFPPIVPQQPHPMAIPPPGTVWTGMTRGLPLKEEHCNVREFMKNNPDAKTFMIACHCSRCGTRCKV